MVFAEYGGKDFETEFIKTPSQKLAFERALLRLRTARKIATLRMSSGMSQAELALRLRTKQPAVSRLEQAKYKPSLRTLEKIAGIFSRRLEINFV